MTNRGFLEWPAVCHLRNHGCFHDPLSVRTAVQPGLSFGRTIIATAAEWIEATSWNGSATANGWIIPTKNGTWMATSASSIPVLWGYLFCNILGLTSSCAKWCNHITLWILFGVLIGSAPHHQLPRIAAMNDQIDVLHQPVSFACNRYLEAVSSVLLVQPIPTERKNRKYLPMAIAAQNCPSVFSFIGAFSAISRTSCRITPAGVWMSRSPGPFSIVWGLAIAPRHAVPL